MVKLREPQFIVATGKKGVGKTFTTIRIIERYIRDNPTTGKQGRKVLIYDVNMEYTQFRTINISDLPRFMSSARVEVRRILPVTKEGKVMHIDEMVALLNEILQNFRGGLLVLEDINRYMTDTKTPEIIGTLATNRHRDLDIICHLQSLSPMTTRMWQNCSVVRFHYQIDDIYRYRQRIPNYELFKIAQCLVNNKYHEGQNRFYCFVYNEENIIKGVFNKSDYRKACEEYLTQHRELIRAHKYRFAKYGRDAELKAMEFVCEDLMKYYGGVRAAA